MMDDRSAATVERAFDLARSGCRSVDEIAIRLKRENFDQVAAHLAGPSLRRQLQRIIAETADARPAADAIDGDRAA